MRLMAEFLAMRVFQNKLAFDEIPDRFKRAVREILKDKYGMEV